MIEVENLVKNYGAKCAVDRVSFTVREGEIVGFLGPNGAGKSTTMNIITGYLAATSGSVRVNGIPVDDNDIEVRKLIGYLPEQPPLYLDMTVDEYLSFVCGLKHVKESRREHLERICEMTGLQQVRQRVIKNLSKGYKQRVGLAQALVGDPQILILDEPTVGLDPIQVVEIRNVIKSLGQSRTVILSSHILPEVQSVCERMLVLNAGRIVADGTPEELSSLLSGHRRLQIKVRGEQDAARAILSGITGINAINLIGEKENGQIDFIVDIQTDTDAREEIFFAFAKAGMPILGMDTVEFSLEDIFLRLTDNKALQAAEGEETDADGAEGKEADADGAAKDEHLEGTR